MWPARLGQRTIGLAMGFGAGVLISGVAFELIGPAITEAESGGHWKVALGLGAGALTFYFGDADHRPHGRRRPEELEGWRRARRSPSRSGSSSTESRSRSRSA